MARRTLIIDDTVSKDALACHISDKYITWENYRTAKSQEWKEIQQYVFATDTSKTSNSKLPWFNKTTIPKLCQIRDNLYANYMASLFPKRKWMQWEGDSSQDETLAKKTSIESYISWAVERGGFYNEMEKLVLDYIDYGNCFAMPYWRDDRIVKADGAETVGYVGPAFKRISPTDIVFDPTAIDFKSTPKIVRSIVSLGDVRQMLENQVINEETREWATNMWNYMKDLRTEVANHKGQVQYKDDIFYVAGFDSFQAYLDSGYAEVLSFYGDIYDIENDITYTDVCIKIVDRHKVIYNKPNASVFGFAPIYHVGWRKRPDNLWAMGPLDNLLGLQYRIDHLENMKADIIDQFRMPRFKVKGYVEDFDYSPLEKIIVGDDGDLEIMAPNPQVLQWESEIAMYEQKMEEMAGSPKEAMGIRTPGEKTMYEVQRLEAAAGRIFQSKINQFERDLVENLLNAYLELAQRNLDKVTIRSFDSEFKIAIFNDLTQEDITGNGRIKPVAARHFAEQANLIQNLTSFLSSVGSDPDIKTHFSSIKLARLFEETLDLEDYTLVEPFVRIAEQMDAQRRMNSMQEQVMMEQQTPTGIGNDFDPEVLNEQIEPTDTTVGMDFPPQGQGPQG